MPELPEVETVKRGLSPLLQQRKVKKVITRIDRLRLPIPNELKTMRNTSITGVERRAKYLLIHTPSGVLLYHLGMTGSLRIIRDDEPPRIHDHVDLILDNGQALRFNDPRRFGLIAWHEGHDVHQHPLLARLGPEPLSSDFNAAYLHQKSRGRRGAVKSFLMDGHVVVGVGNIYASESLYLAGIHPKRAAGRISLQRYEALTTTVRQVLKDAIKAGGTTLKDFQNSEGNPGYFYRKLKVYDREGQACDHCGGHIRRMIIGQRSTYYCAHCQH